MKHQTSKILSLLLLIIGISLGSMTAKANDYTLSTNDAWQSGSIQTEGQSNFYTVSIPRAGHLTIDLQAWSLESSHWYLLSEDLTKSYEETSLWYASDSNPKTSTFENWMEAGVYKVKVCADGKGLGNYKIKASFKAANNTETEPNNDFSKAMKLSSNQQVTGLISCDDEMDFYKMTLNSKSIILFNYLSYAGTSYFEIWDDDFLSVKKQEVWYATEREPKSYVEEVSLDAGVYYIKISKSYSSKSNNGLYKLKYSTVSKVSSISISKNKQVVAGKSFTLSAKVSPSGATNKKIAWSSDNTSVATVNENTGKVKTNRAGTAHITASALDGSGTSKSVTVVVIPKKNSGFKIKKSTLYKRRVYSSWDYQSGVNGYQLLYGTKKNFSGAKKKICTGTGYTFNTLPKKKYYFKVRAFIRVGSKKVYGAWSSVKSCKVS